MQFKGGLGRHKDLHNDARHQVSPAIKLINRYRPIPVAPTRPKRLHRLPLPPSPISPLLTDLIRPLVPASRMVQHPTPTPPAIPTPPRVHRTHHHRPRAQFAPMGETAQGERQVPTCRRYSACVYPGKRPGSGSCVVRYADGPEERGWCGWVWEGRYEVVVWKRT